MGITKQYFNRQQYYDYIIGIMHHFEDKYSVKFDKVDRMKLMTFADAIYEECIPEELIQVEIPEDMPELIKQISAVVEHYDSQFNFLVTGIMMSEMANIQLRKRIKGGDD